MQAIIYPLVMSTVALLTPEEFAQREEDLEWFARVEWEQEELRLDAEYEAERAAEELDYYTFWYGLDDRTARY